MWPHCNYPSYILSWTQPNEDDPENEGYSKKKTTQNIKWVQTQKWKNCKNEDESRLVLLLAKFPPTKFSHAAVVFAAWAIFSHGTCWSGLKNGHFQSNTIFCAHSFQHFSTWREGHFFLLLLYYLFIYFHIPHKIIL